MDLSPNVLLDMVEGVLWRMKLENGKGGSPGTSEGGIIDANGGEYVDAGSYFSSIFGAGKK
jgi:hypothetical protein